MDQHEQIETAQFLDQMIPLKGASHVDVVNYGIDIPMRYSECFAKLADGRVVRLKDSRKFIGWAGMNGSRRLLFADDQRQIELQPGTTSPVDFRELQGGIRFVAKDGSLQVMESKRH